jgi:hypothetical protein
MPLRLVMLSPYRMPAHHALMLGDADTLAWQNAWRLLWHPGLLQQADQLPFISDAADHAMPQAETLYVMPESPAPYVPENWYELARQNGVATVLTTRDWSESLSRLYAAVAGVCDPVALSAKTDDASRVCFALGLGYAVVETLFEAMDHTKTLDVTAFTAEVNAAAAGDMTQATAAAERLLIARETLYPAPIHLLDLAILGQGELPDSLNGTTPLTLITTADSLAALSAEHLAKIRKRLDDGRLELCGGINQNRPDAALTVESQLWNLRRGQERLRELVGKPATVFARADTTFHPYLPNWLAQADISNLFYISFDGGTIPHHAAATIRWPAPDGRQVDAITRAPFPASDPQTGFHLAMHLHQTIMQDSSAVLFLRHGEPKAEIWYDDWLALSALAPVLGTWTTASRFLDEATVGEYASATSMDDYAPDMPTTLSDPISSFARHARIRRRIDAARTHQALLQSLGTSADVELLQQIDGLENGAERSLGVETSQLASVETESATRLARRLVARSTGGQSGRLLLNPCPFTRRVGLELTGMTGLPLCAGPTKAVQRDGDVTRLVVEVPGLGYSWIPDGDAELMPARMTLATGTTVRNEFFEAEIDPETGGLRTFRDPHGRANVLGQQLVWQPGSTMRASDVRVTACGPAFGEVTAAGELLDEHGQRLAGFVQRFRCWLGRPLLELRIELHPDKPPSGYPWHAYYAARFAGRDENTSIVRGVFGHSSATTHNRPGSPDYLEFHSGKSSALVVTGGLPFAQRHAQRMIDVLLVTAGETCTEFQLSLGLNRPQPAQSAQGMVSPIAVVRLQNGPPPSGPSSWLAHLDSSHVLLTSLRPAKESNAILARLFEIAGLGGSANLRFARDPRSAALVDSGGLLVMDCLVDGDAVTCDVMAHDLVNLRVEWA